MPVLPKPVINRRIQNITKFNENAEPVTTTASNSMHKVNADFLPSLINSKKYLIWYTRSDKKRDKRFTCQQLNQMGWHQKSIQP